MKSQYLKVRMTQEAYSQLKLRAAEAGKTISNFANELIRKEDELQIIRMKVDAIDSCLNELVILVNEQTEKSKLNEKFKFVFFETLLINREIAMKTDIQIMKRVSSKINDLKGKTK